MPNRVHNFSAGPAALPLPVLEEAQRQLVDFESAGMSIMEMSHRGKIYDRVHNEALDDLRKLLGAGDDYQLLFMGGGARTQFALLAMNLLARGRGDYIITGTWSDGALKNAQKIGSARAIYSSAESGHDHVPAVGAYEVANDASYLHYTSNNTIYGTEFSYTPDSGKVPLVCDMSSDILSRPVDVSRYGLIYAGAQKNIGPAGVTLVVIRKDLLERASADLPEMFSYKKVAAKNSMLNTPPVFPIYMVGLVAKHLLKEGGAQAAAQRNDAKAKLLYDTIDGSGGFYKPHAKADSRSRMNVTFRLADEALEADFVAEAGKQNIVGVKGHRSVGGIRASIYNAVQMASVETLVGFMRDFQKQHG